jgi:hypothetical protein
MHNYDTAIKRLEKDLASLKGGYVYIYNSPLEGDERLEAIGKVKSRIMRLNEAIETLKFLGKK